MGRFPEATAPTCQTCGIEKLRARESKRCLRCSRTPGWHLAEDDGSRLPLEYEAAWAAWQRFIGQAKDRYTGPAKRPVRIGRQRIVIASDFHMPFHHPAAVATLFAREADADCAIFAGDLLDSYSVSRFLKYESCPIESEFAAATLILEQASQTWPRVLVLEGNHDKPRFQKQLLDRLPAEMIKYVQFLAGGNLSAIRAIARRFPNVEVVNTKVGKYDVDWLVQVNDLLVCHAEKFSKVPGSVLRGLEDWLSDQERTLGLAPWRVVCQAHTHQLGWFPFKADKLLIELGCLSGPHQYQLDAKIGGRPQRLGYVTLEQIDGKTDIESVRMHWLDDAVRAA